MSSENPQITGEQVAHAYYQKKNVNQILEVKNSCFSLAFWFF